MIAQKNQDLSYFFMDLCFDIICVFAHAFGTLPPQSGLDITWLEKQVSMMGTELQAVLKNQTMDAQIQKKLQDRLIEREKENPAHVKLTQFLNIINPVANAPHCLPLPRRPAPVPSDSFRWHSAYLP